MFEISRYSFARISSLLQRLHKALAFRVVPWIRQTAHACNDSMTCPKHCRIRPRRIESLDRSDGPALELGMRLT